MTRAPSLDEVAAGRRAVGVEIADAQSTFDAAAYRAAVTPSDETQAALAKARARLESLKAEHGALDAVERESKRLESASAWEARCRALDDAKRETLALSAERAEAMARVGRAIDELRDALSAEARIGEAAMAKVLEASRLFEARGAAERAVQWSYLVQANPNPSLWMLEQMRERIGGHPLASRIELTGVNAHPPHAEAAARDTERLAAEIAGWVIDKN